MIITLKIELDNPSVPVEEDELENFLSEEGIEEDDLDSDLLEKLGTAALDAIVEDADGIDDISGSIGGSIKKLTLQHVQFDDESEIDLP
ncbi:hypothetical protein SEA_AUSTIN_50 [Gordonia phage Austin]|nr:hypothetical protein SEA_AUSTIN_50 [Gordonia phage Austin]